MRLLKILALLVVVVAPASRTAAEAVTVQSLLKQQYVVVGTYPSQIGPGLFLQKQDQLFLCFISETPQSTAVTTNYCKPVR